jgi:outer membrane lipoprotein-sorting protein
MTPPNLDEFDFNLLGEEEVDGTLCWQLEMMPLNDDVADENGFSKKVSFVGKEDFVIRKAVYYDLDGSLLKELIVKEIKLIDPERMKYRLMEMEMVNKQNGRISKLKVDKIQFNPDVKDEYFTTRYLERE